MTLEDFKSYSEEYLASYGNMSRNTQDQKRRGVEKFIRFMESEGRQEIDQKAILAYRKSLLGYSRNTFAQYISRLNTALEWMVESGMLDKHSRQWISPTQRPTMWKKREQTSIWERIFLQRDS
jgi:site-specific recombinase XerD